MVSLLNAGLKTQSLAVDYFLFFYERFVSVAALHAHACEGLGMSQCLHILD